MTAPTAPTSPVQLQCMEVWGGNQAVSSGVAMPGLDAWVFARPHRGDASGGDVHYLSSCATGRITRLMIADVSGHGESASATAIKLRGLMRRFINHLDQRNAVGLLNEAFTRTEDSGRFATAILGTFWEPTGELVLCNAGHPRPLWYRSRERRWVVVDSGADATDGIIDIPLGVLDSAKYRQFGVQLAAGDMLLLYTDSLVEARIGGSLLGEAGLIAAAEAVNAADRAGFIEGLLAEITRRGGAFDDDITAMLIRPTGVARKRGLWESVRALGRIARGVLSRKDPTGLPELGVRTAGGLVADRFNR